MAPEELSGKAVIFLTEERVYGYLISLGAYVSRVYYVTDGMDVDTYIENDEYILMEEEEPFTYERE